MKQITIKDDLNNEYPGTMPEGWHEVPVQTFITYVRDHQDMSTANRMVHVTYLLSGIPINILREDMGIAALIHKHCTWFYDTLPEAVPVETITHQGREFVYAGDLYKVNAGQFEALLEYINQANGKPLTQINWLLAVLYAERDVPQTAETVAANAALFLTLPMDQAYGAVGFFLANSHDSALRILKFSEMEVSVKAALTNLENHLQKSSSTTRGVLRRKYFGLLLSKLKQLKESVNKI